MIDWQHIAHLLTKRWTDEGKLPIEQDGKSYNFIFPTVFTDFPNDFLRYACEEEFMWEDKKYTQILVRGQISKQDAINNVWQDLTETEKTTIMAEVLGQ